MKGKIIMKNENQETKKQDLSFKALKEHIKKKYQY